MTITGTAKIDYKTKNLIKRLQPGDIAIINHEDIDEVGANGLTSCKVKAVINAAKSITGRYPNPGPGIILDANIPIIDDVGEQIMSYAEGSRVTITDNGEIYIDDMLVAKGELLSSDKVKVQMEAARKNMENSLDTFINNTLEYAKKEK